MADGAMTMTKEWKCLQNTNMGLFIEGLIAGSQIRVSLFASNLKINNSK
jgi:hypothetical protein